MIGKVLDIYKVINMTREEAKELLPIIQAFAEGKTIEFKNCCGNWNSCGNVLIPGIHNDFRIKSEPKYRPFKDADECWQEMQKHQPFGWIKSKDGTTTNKFMFINALKNNGISICISVDFFYSDSVKYYTFVDGTPFGIKIE